MIDRQTSLSRRAGSVCRAARAPRRRWTALAAASLLAATAAAARAESADDLVKKGIELRRQGRDNDALVEFQKAMKIQSTPRIQAQTALAEQALGLWVAAEQDLLAALSHKSDHWIKKNAGTLQGALSTVQEHLGSLDLWGSPAGATLFVNEKPAGTLPLGHPVRVSAESLVVRAHAEGYLDSTRTLRVAPGQTVREHVELVPVPAAPPLPAATARPDVAAGSEPNGGATDMKSPGPGDSTAGGSTDRPPEASSESQLDSGTGGGSRKLRAFAWVTAVGAAGGLALGVVETFAAAHNRTLFNNHIGPDPVNPGQTINDCNTDNLSDACRPLLHNYNNSVKLAIVGYAAGAALGIGSAVLFWASSGSRADRASRTALACAPDVGSPGVACLLIF